MDQNTITPHIEALIFASEKPLNTAELVELLNNALGFMDDRASEDQVEQALATIVERYESPSFPFQIKQVGGGWQFLSKEEYHKTIAQLNGDKFLKKLSTAALETLSIIAYKQPVTKSEVEIIRGVNCDYAVQKLLEKELVLIAGRNEDAIGKPLIYTTSKSFMDYFGINSPEGLPRIREVLMEELVEATKIGNNIIPGSAENAEGSPLAVNNEGLIVESSESEQDKQATNTEHTPEGDPAA